MKYIKAIVEYKVPVSTENENMEEVAASAQLEVASSAVTLDSILHGAEVIAATFSKE